MLLLELPMSLGTEIITLSAMVINDIIGYNMILWIFYPIFLLFGQCLLAPYCKVSFIIPQLCQFSKMAVSSSVVNLVMSSVNGDSSWSTGLNMDSIELICQSLMLLNQNWKSCSPNKVKVIKM
ncbi:hypothetical protein CHUAL_012091 [Chamberlinius hualienensis]